VIPPPTIKTSYVVEERPVSNAARRRVIAVCPGS
jgi:hypothetical protein